MKISLSKGIIIPLLILPLALGTPASIPKQEGEIVPVNDDSNTLKDTSSPGNVQDNHANGNGNANDNDNTKVQKHESEPESEPEPKSKPESKAKANEDESQKEDTKPKSKLPPSLNIENFDAITSEKLSFVEFYSPYCHHCKALAPIWEQAYLEFEEEAKSLNIQMRQVNCVENGDLCGREDISYFPYLRLYAPERDVKTGQIIPGKSKFVDTFPRSLVRTSENFKKYLRKSVAEYDDGTIDMPSSSKLLDTDEMLNILAGSKEEVYFVSFFPATDEQYLKVDSTKKNHFSKCNDCFEYKQIWDRLSNHLQIIAKTGHFNCQSNPTLCKELQLTELTTPGVRATPKFAVFLPKSTGRIRFDYKGEVSIDKMKQWIVRLFQNSQYEKITARTLGDVMSFRKSLPNEPLDSYYPLENKISVIFYFDETTVSDEDKAILPYLLDYVTYSPFNMYLYTATHSQIEKGVLSQAENLINYVNYDPNEPRQRFHVENYLSTTLTAKPTILIFKDNTLITNVYQNFAPEDMRDYKKISKFISDSQYPLYQELTPELIPYYFNTDILDKRNEKVVVTFIDSTDASKLNIALYNMSLAAHEYHHLKKQYYFNKLSFSREEKEARVEKLKHQNADSIEVIKELRREIPHLFNYNQVLFTFIDLSKKDQFEHAYKWKIDPDDYKVGDTIVITKDNRYYWDQAIDGSQLTNNPSVIKPLLLSLLDNSLVTTQNHAITKLVGSPYGSKLRFMDKIHDRGVIGYIGLFGFIYLMYIVIIRLSKKKRLFKSKSSGSASGYGIIGNVQKKEKD
ncbi:uncharacterized protein RJT21DRAFT_101740 [Scheffersomyces amazonensis]|uniref:uncharacterized protein n=1 Tax=Scheffersomyces amazonensis TaxID=1078765 RepID=UPI00315CF25A